MWAKLKSILSAFKAGETVAEAIKAKQWTLAVNAAGTLALVALQTVHLWGYGLDIDLSDEQVNSITAGAVTLLGLFNHGGTVVSTDKIDGLGRATVQPVDTTGESFAGQSGYPPLDSPRPKTPLPPVNIPIAPDVIANDFDKQRERDSGG